MKFLNMIALAILFILGTPSFKNDTQITSIEVFYFENKGAWTETPENILSVYKKKCVITNQKSISKIQNEISIIESSVPTDKYAVRCNIVVRLSQGGVIKTIGFDMGSSKIVEINKVTYSSSGKLLSLIKKKCTFKWK